VVCGSYTPQHNQFTLHANTYIAPLDRKGLEKMIRYLCRPALATERVELLENDEVVRLRLKTPWRDGTTHIRMAAAEFVLRLLALIPAPHKKQIRYLGVFAANAKWRREVVLRPSHPSGPRRKSASRARVITPTRRPARTSCSQATQSQGCHGVWQCGGRSKLTRWPATSVADDARWSP
jgi:hypothetical protein